MNQKPLIIIPTLNEGRTIRALGQEILSIKDLEILIVDDASTDQTRAEIQQLSQAYPGRVHFLFREKANGIGSAYLAGFHWALTRSYTAMVQMDGDGSHDPRFLEPMVAALQNASLVVGSRYIPGSRPQDTFQRRCISRFGNFLAKRYVKGPLRDMTGGFNGWQRQLLARITAKPFQSQGHAFQLELKARALREKAEVLEIPITFRPRQYGKSKLRLGHFLESLRLLRQLRSEPRNE